jgi:hypothetical protein
VLLDEQHLPLVSQLCLATKHVPELLLLGDIGLPGALLYNIECMSCSDAGSHHHQYFYVMVISLTAVVPLSHVPHWCMRHDSCHGWLCSSCA